MDEAWGILPPGSISNEHELVVGNVAAVWCLYPKWRYKLEFYQNCPGRRTTITNLPGYPGK